MKAKLKEYMDTIFADAEKKAPDSQRLWELKEEMLRNLYDRYDDLLAGGKSPAAAYNAAVAGVGDVTELLDAVVGESDTDAESAPSKQKKTASMTPEEVQRVKAYKKRSAILTAAAVSMYIVCWLPMTIIGALTDSDIGGAIGLAIMFLMIAGATAILIYTDMNKPKGMESDDDADDDEADDDDDDGRHSTSPACKVISAFLWPLTICAYLLISFKTQDWHITWVIFPIAAALEGAIKALFDWGGRK